MRISTNQIFDAGALGIQQNQQNLFKLQNQLSSGRRVLTPEDDPVAAAQALIVTQSKELVGQYEENQGSAKSDLGVLEGNLATLSDMLLAVYERAYDSKNRIYSDSERNFVAQELRDRLTELVALANTDDGTGQYLFSGYQGATKPFAIDGTGTIVPPATTPPVRYFGDEGERLLQVGASRQMATNVSGAELFMNIRSGNGSFSTAVGGNSGGGINQGTALIDSGSVSNPALWTAAVNAHGSFRIEFSAGGTQYQIYNAANVAMLAAPASFVPGQAIPLQKTTAPAADFGAQVVISGTPANGDRFTITPSSNQSLFQTIQNLIGAIDTPVNLAYTSTELENRVNAELANLNQALDNIGRVRADVGSRLKELDFLGENAADLDLQYATTLSELQDLDYTEAISKFTQQQIQLEAAQKAFAQTARLSLFDIL
ncbi:MAG: flagellar hook-associated protein FlgL [Rhodocyclaceae bacterium]|nr:flagellar hook-associated protein FlgL [Rhodocyclaceae bacterium]